MNRKTTWVNNGKYAVLNCGADCEYTGDCPHRGGLNYDGMMPCYRQACIELAKLEDMLESGQLVELPSNIVLNDYNKSLIQNIKAEEIKFSVGNTVYKILDTVIHFANKPPKKPKYILISGQIKAIYHIFCNRFRVQMEVVVNEQGHYRCVDQKECFTDKTQAEARLKELQEGQTE